MCLCFCEYSFDDFFSVFILTNGQNMIYLFIIFKEIMFSKRLYKQYY